MTKRLVSAKQEIINKMYSLDKDYINNIFLSYKKQGLQFSKENYNQCMICKDVCGALNFWFTFLNEKAILMRNQVAKFTFKQIFNRLIKNKENNNRLAVKIDNLIICKECLNHILNIKDNIF